MSTKAVPGTESGSAALNLNASNNPSAAQPKHSKKERLNPQQQTQLSAALAAQQEMMTKQGTLSSHVPFPQRDIQQIGGGAEQLSEGDMPEGVDVNDVDGAADMPHSPSMTPSLLPQGRGVPRPGPTPTHAAPLSRRTQIIEEFQQHQPSQPSKGQRDRGGSSASAKAVQGYMDRQSQAQPQMASGYDRQLSSLLAAQSPRGPSQSPRYVSHSSRPQPKQTHQGSAREQTASSSSTSANKPSRKQEAAQDVANIRELHTYLADSKLGIYFDKLGMGNWLGSLNGKSAATLLAIVKDQDVVPFLNKYLVDLASSKEPLTYGYLLGLATHDTEFRDHFFGLINGVLEVQKQANNPALQQFLDSSPFGVQGRAPSPVHSDADEILGSMSGLGFDDARTETAQQADSSREASEVDEASGAEEGDDVEEEGDVESGSDEETVTKTKKHASKEKAPQAQQKVDLFGQLRAKSEEMMARGKEALRGWQHPSSSASASATKKQSKVQVQVSERNRSDRRERTEHKSDRRDRAERKPKEEAASASRPTPRSRQNVELDSDLFQ